jgi:ABC-type polysaccharide/polyol phosphate export permease
VFVTLLFSNILTLSEINAEAYFRNTISPVTPLLMPAGVFLSTYVLVMFQVTILLLIGQYWFKVQLLPVLLQTYVLASLLIFVFTLIGMILAYLIKTQEISVLTTTFVALGVYLFSSIVTPLELMPIIASKIAAFNPVVLGEVMFKKLLLYQIPLFYSIEALLTIIIYILILTIITLFLNNKMHDSQ